MTPGDDGHAEDFWWGILAARVLHPVQVEIIEALWWIDQPLSAVDLVLTFEGQHSRARIEHQLRRLAKLGAASVKVDRRAGGRLVGQRSYRAIRRREP